MHDKMIKMMEKRKKDGKGGMDPVEQKAKHGVLSDLRDMASQAMSDRLHGLKKVSVSSDSEQGLEHGLDKAKEIVKGMPEGVEEPEGPQEEEAQESPEEESAEQAMGYEEMSEADIDAKLAELMAKKKALSKS